MKLKVNSLYFSYPGKEVLKGINLDLNEKEIKCIVGPNGSGKSTLVKCIEGLLVPKCGKIIFDDRDSSSLSRLDIARMIGYVPQSSRQVFSTSVFDMVLMGRKPHYSWRCSDEDLNIVADVLQLLDLDKFAMEDFTNLSGGQQQRVLIARALAQQPQLLLLDEPTSALDISHQLDVMEIIHDIVTSRNIGAIMVVHDLNLAARYADSILMLHSGVAYSDGPPDKTMTVSNIREVYDVEANVYCEAGTLSIIPVCRVKKRK